MVKPGRGWVGLTEGNPECVCSLTVKTVHFGTFRHAEAGQAMSVPCSMGDYPAGSTPFEVLNGFMRIPQIAVETTGRGLLKLLKPLMALPLISIV